MGKTISFWRTIAIGAGLLAAFSPNVFASPQISSLTPPPAISADGNIRLSKTARTLSPGLWEVTLTITAGPFTSSGSQIDVLFVTDHSASMGEQTETVGQSRLDAARQAQLSLLERLAEQKVNARIGMVTFSDDARLLQPLLPLLDPSGQPDEKNILALRSAIEGQVPQGQTNLEDGLFLGEQVLFPQGDAGKKNPKYLILLSDGDPSARLPDPSSAGRTPSSAAIRRAKQIKTSHPGLTLCTISLSQERGCLPYLASSGHDHRTFPADLEMLFQTILQTPLRAVKDPMVLDQMGPQVDLITPPEDLIPSVGSAVLGPDGQIFWDIGPWLAGTVSLVYQVRRNDAPAHDGTIPLNREAAFTCQTQNGKDTALSFPIPTAAVSPEISAVPGSGILAVISPDTISAPLPKTGGRTLLLFSKGAKAGLWEGF